MRHPMCWSALPILILVLAACVPEAKLSEDASEGGAGSTEGGASGDAGSAGASSSASEEGGASSSASGNESTGGSSSGGDSSSSASGGSLVASGGNAGSSTGGSGNNGSAGNGLGGGAAGAASVLATGGDSSTGGVSSSIPTVCANPVVLSSALPNIANFESYDGTTNLSDWSFPLGGSSVTGQFAGPYAYGDFVPGSVETPETFELSAGHESTYALRIADPESDQFGGGMGLWLSNCLDASVFDGISFWVHGAAPTGAVKLSLLMEETAPVTEVAPSGSCPGTADSCIPPFYMFPVTDTWTEVQIPWVAFISGTSVNNEVVPDGSNIWQVQFDVGLEWSPDADGVYQAVPAAYELVIDDLRFY